MSRRPTSALVVSFALLLLPAAVLAAGNVQVSTSAVDVDIDGDSAANELSIAYDGDRRISVTGANGTTVNGGASATVAVSGKLDIRLRDGDDRIVMIGVVLPDDVRVDLGAGRDVFRCHESSMEGLSVTGDAGVDDIIAQLVTVRGDLKLQGRDGRDTINLAFIDIGGKTSLDGGAEDDTFRLDALSPSGPFSLSAGGGNDAVLVLSSQFAAQTAFDLDASDDRITMNSVTADKAVVIDGGGGADTYTDAGGNVFQGSLVLRRIVAQ